MQFEDREVRCADCGEGFTFSARDQEFFAAKGFSEPKRCPNCRRARKNRREGSEPVQDAARFEVICAECGQRTTVPFEPRGTRPVYCRDCFEQIRGRR